jgi:hypothetical protein
MNSFASRALDVHQGTQIITDRLALWNRNRSMNFFTQSSQTGKTPSLKSNYTGCAEETTTEVTTTEARDRVRGLLQRAISRAMQLSSLGLPTDADREKFIDRVVEAVPIIPLPPFWAKHCYIKRQELEDEIMKLVKARRKEKSGELGGRDASSLSS